jgi:hypothetical protein
LYRKVTKKKFESTPKEETYGDELCLVGYVKSDETFYNMALREIKYNRKKMYECEYHTDPRFLQLVEKYKAQGWNIEKCPVEIKEMYERKEAKTKVERRDENFVLWKDYKDLIPKDYNGGFSAQVTTHEEFVNYVNSGCVWGYIGHKVRKPALDKFIEETFLSLNVTNHDQLLTLFVNWLSSTDGRHFGDKLEGKSLEEQKKIFLERVNRIYNVAMIYSHPEHEGTLKSTIEIEEKIKSILL